MARFAGFLLGATICVAAVGCSPPAVAGGDHDLWVQPVAEPTVRALAWMEGAWRCAALGGVCEETWTAPSRGQMLGMFRLLHDDGVGFTELITIEDDPGHRLVMRLKHFDSDFRGWEEQAETIDFPLVEMRRGSAVFEGLEVRRQGPDAMLVRVNIQSDGASHWLEFPYQRIAR
ncbi:MAG TPA: DUF6265 family protein [Planctomycetota bacterium]